MFGALRGTERMYCSQVHYKQMQDFMRGVPEAIIEERERPYPGLMPYFKKLHSDHVGKGPIIFTTAFINELVPEVLRYKNFIFVNKREKSLFMARDTQNISASLFNSDENKILRTNLPSFAYSDNVLFTKEIGLDKNPIMKRFTFSQDKNRFDEQPAPRLDKDLEGFQLLKLVDDYLYFFNTENVVKITKVNATELKACKTFTVIGDINQRTKNMFKFSHRILTSSYLYNLDPADPVVETTKLSNQLNILSNGEEIPEKAD